MFNKILLTVLVLIATALYLKQRNTAGSNTAQTASENPNQSSALSNTVVAYTFVALILAIGLIFYAFDWQDNHKIYDVKVINSLNNQTSVYQVYKKDLKKREFETLEGQLVQVADNERLETSLKHP